MNHFTAHLKLTQYCYLTIFQLKKPAFVGMQTFYFFLVFGQFFCSCRTAIIWGEVEIQIHHFFFCPHFVACGTSVSQPRIEPGPWQWKQQILATRAPENFLISILNYFFLSCLFQSEDHTEIFVLLEATKNIFCSSYSYYILYFA